MNMIVATNIDGSPTDPHGRFAHEATTPPGDWRDPPAGSSVFGTRDRMGTEGVDNIFWGAASLGLLGVLIGLLVLMLAEDVHRAMADRHPRAS